MRSMCGRFLASWWCHSSTPANSHEFLHGVSLLCWIGLSLSASKAGTYPSSSNNQWKKTPLSWGPQKVHTITIIVYSPTWSLPRWVSLYTACQMLQQSLTNYRGDWRECQACYYWSKHRRWYEQSEQIIEWIQNVDGLSHPRSGEGKRAKVNTCDSQT